MEFESLGSWVPTATPTNYVLSTVAPSLTSNLASLMALASSRAVSQTSYDVLQSLAFDYYGAQASLSIASAAQVTATATNSAVIASAQKVLYDSSLFLKYKYDTENHFDYNLTYPPEAIFAAVFGISVIFNVLMLIKSKYWWFNIAFICGGGLELASYIVRILAVTAPQVSTYYLLQIVALIIGPAFFTGGIYFLFAQFVVAHGRKYSMLKPMWYSYLFISFDFTSLVIQAIGGAMASLATQQNKSSKPGTYLMLAGIAFQAVSMSVFFFFWIESLTRVFFKDKILDINGEIHPLSKRSFLNFFKLLFNIGEAKQYKMNELEKFYNPKFAEVRSRKLFTWFPLVITSSTVLILIRCIYRVVELAQGFRGWLITREWPLMVFDATMIGLVALLFIPFHPVFVLGSKNIVKLSLIKNNLDEITEEENTEEESSEEEKLYQ